MKLVQSTIPEIGKLQKLCAEAYIGNFANHWKDNAGLDLYVEEQFSTVRLTKDLQDPDCDYFFVVDNDEAVGFMKVLYHKPIGSYSKDNSCELEKIYMRPNHKGKGYGQFTLNKLFNICRLMDKKVLFLCVLDTNFPSIEFYKKMGFQFHSTTQLKEPNFKEELKGMHRMIYFLD